MRLGSEQITCLLIILALPGPNRGRGNTGIEKWWTGVVKTTEFEEGLGGFGLRKRDGPDPCPTGWGTETITNDQEPKILIYREEVSPERTPEMGVLRGDSVNDLKLMDKSRVRSTDRFPTVPPVHYLWQFIYFLPSFLFDIGSNGFGPQSVGLLPFRSVDLPTEDRTSTVYWYRGVYCLWEGAPCVQRCSVRSVKAALSTTSPRSTPVDAVIVHVIKTLYLTTDEWCSSLFNRFGG